MQSKLSYLLRAVTILALLTNAVLPALAQNATGSINGTVKDQNDAIITTATVTATNKGNGQSRKVKAGNDGAFVFENLQPGEYEVKVEAEGFTTLTQSLVVQVGNTTTNHYSMTVGAVRDIVDVTGTSTPVINRTDTVIGGVVDKRQVENLPLNGRSFLSVAALEPGVNINYVPTSGAGNVNNFFQISVGGAPQSMTFISVDGARVNDRVTGGTSQNFSAETVQEFQISTLGFDLSTGTVSAGAVNIVSRTGTNNLHGSAFLFFRDHNLSAFPGFKRPTDPTALSPFCANPNSEGCQRLQDPYFVRKQYGGTIGGPLKKDKLFFFGNYERNDQVGANTVTFGDPRLFGFNHISKQPQDGHLIGTRLDYTLSQKHNGFIRGNIDANDSISGSGLESRWITSSNYAYQTQMGVTSVFKPTLVNDFRFSYSYFRNRLRQPTQEECTDLNGDPGLCFGIDGPQITFFGGLTTGTNVNVSQDRHPRTFQWTDNVNWTKGSHRVRFGGNYEMQNSHGSWNQNSHGTYSAFSPDAVAASSAPGAAAIYAALPASLKPGYTGPRPTFQELLQLPMTGTITIGLGDPGQPAPYKYKDILTNHNVRFYGQDAWQAFQGFTLNYGLAWSFESQIFYTDLPDLPKYLTPLIGTNLKGPGREYKNFDPALGFAWAIGKDQKTVIRSSASLHHISGNVGFYALNQRILFGPAGNGLQPVVGSGLPNPEAPATLLNFTVPTNFTVGDMLNYLPAATALLNASLPFKGDDTSIQGVEIFKTIAGAQLLDAIYNSDSSRAPYTVQVNAGVQQEILHNLSVTVDYVMRRGVGFGAGVSGFDQFFPDLNRWNRFSGYALSPTTGAATILGRNPVIPACTAAQSALARTDPRAYAAAQCSLGPIQYGLPGILSRYQALQVKVDKRFSHGLQFTGSYALARYTTLVSISNNDNLHEGHGISAGSPRHRFTGSAIWELPKYKGDFKVLRGILNDWQISTLMEMRTGTPTSVTLGTLDVEGDGTFVFRLPGTTVSSFGYNLGTDDIRRLVNEYNASIPAGPNTILKDITRAQRDAIGVAYPFVVLPQNFASNDSFLSHDLRVTRAIRLTERVKLNLIAEGFNIFNIANLTGFSGTLDAYIRPTANAAGTITAPGRNPTFNFGQPTGRVNPIFGTGGPRAFQLAARLSF
jgi:hypothetical protein